MELDSTDKKLLSIIQAELPLHPEPFAVLGYRLNMNSNEVIRRIEQLKKEGIIRQIGPVFNPASLGYQTTLIAMKLAAHQLAEAGRTITAHPQVSHCYEREHDFNFWFTLALPTEDNVEGKAQELGKRIKAETTLNLPAVKVFKIRTYFTLGNGKLSASHHSQSNDKQYNYRAKLSMIQRAIVNELQQDLPLIERPFDLMASRLSMEADEFILHCRVLLQLRIMRRYSASINHNKLGFAANVMACWKVPPELVDSAGKIAATFPEISHCYERRTNPLWPYNLFAMIHAATKDESQAIAKKMSAESGLDESDMVLLYTAREIKKTRIRYNV